MRFKIIIFMVAFFSISVTAQAEKATINTEHFTIRHNAEFTGFALRIADLAENFYSQIENFLEFSLYQRINIEISNSSSFLNSIVISPEVDFSESKDFLYKKIFFEFFNGQDGISYNDSQFIDSLQFYAKNGFSAIDRLVITDFFHNRKDQIIDLRNLSNPYYSSLNCAFFDFINQKFGRKIFLRSLKDSAFFGSFESALEKHSGVTKEENKNLFIQYLKENFNSDIESKNLIIGEDVEDFAISGEVLALILRDNSKFSLAIYDNIKGNILRQIYLPADYNYKTISIWAKQIVVAGTSLKGSGILLFDKETLTLQKNLFYPYIYIKKAAIAENGNIVFSIYGGDSQGFVVFDIESFSLGNVFFVNDDYRDFILEGNSILLLKNSPYGELLRLQDSNNSVLFYLPDVSFLNRSLYITAISYLQNRTEVKLLNSDFSRVQVIFSCKTPIYKSLYHQSRLYNLTLRNGKRCIEVVDLSLNSN
ncbi:MAG: hypothetical protein BWY23_02667 [Spirochaetes bacterium ADurb.Bin218]|jgi:hypothetical protein|nr:hypothetical protein [Spirochaetota bacterium]OQA94786.1 MAG: hypothetical protein BWY23_02667 [Spirochaetes bacterium ADurb.Bin218]HOV09253.1 hypothetical protein [Spirochaetota bacterium]